MVQVASENTAQEVWENFERMALPTYDLGVNEKNLVEGSFWAGMLAGAELALRLRLLGTETQMHEMYRDLSGYQPTFTRKFAPYKILNVTQIP